MKWITFASFVIFVIFNMIGIRKFGMKDCFSAYGKLWKEAVPIKNMNLWSIVLGVCAALIIPPMIQSLEGNPWQFIGFLAPAYLFLTIFTPDYDATKKTHIIHNIGAYTCIVGIFIWALLLMHMWIPVLACILLFFAIGYCARNLKECWMYYAELSILMIVYWILLTV